MLAQVALDAHLRIVASVINLVTVGDGANKQFIHNSMRVADVIAFEAPVSLFIQRAGPKPTSVRHNDMTPDALARGSALWATQSHQTGFSDTSGGFSVASLVVTMIFPPNVLRFRYGLPRSEPIHP